jgi:hypothetical protein
MPGCVGHTTTSCLLAVSARNRARSSGRRSITANRPPKKRSKQFSSIIVYHDKPFDKTHDVGVLLKLALPFDSVFSPMSGAANRLSRYAVVYRYPSEEPEPEPEQFDAALRDVEDLFTLVLQRLPASTYP